MKVSIITSTFNSEKFLQATIDSISQQTYRNIEHIIIDGASTDNTLNIIKENNSKIAKWVSEPDGGTYFALNKGLKIASGDIIGFLHSDDLFGGEYSIQQVVDTFVSTRCDVVYGDLVYVHAENPERIIRYWKSRDFRHSILKKGWMPPHPTMFMSAQVIRGTFFNTSYKISADYEFILRLLKFKSLKINYVPEILIKMRLGGISNRSFKNIIEKSREDYRSLVGEKMKFPLLILFLKNIRKLVQFVTFL